jgi:hypothetical protein
MKSQRGTGCYFHCGIYAADGSIRQHTVEYDIARVNYSLDTVSKT